LGRAEERSCTPPAWRGGAAAPSGRAEGRSAVGLHGGEERRPARRGGAAAAGVEGRGVERPAWRGARAEMWAGDGWRRSEQKLGKLVLSSFFACSVNEVSAVFRWLENLPRLG